MTPQEKAKELVDSMYDETFYLRDGYNSSEVRKAVIKCALIAVDECIKYEQKIRTQIQSVNFPNSFIIILNDGVFWEEVKHEINNL